MLKKRVSKVIMFVLCDIAFIIVASIFALLLRFDFSISAIGTEYLENVISVIPINICFSLFMFFLFKMYNSLWNFASVTEMQNIILASIITSVNQSIIINVMNLRVPRSYYFLYLFILTALLLLSRFSYRAVRLLKRKIELNNEGINTMIIGAGKSANIIISEIASSEKIGLNVKCIIDDDSSKIGSFIRGIKVVGDRSEIKYYVGLMDIKKIIIAMPSVPMTITKEIIDICKDTKCDLKILPGIYQLMNGDVNISKLRNVEIEDLLGRTVIDIKSDIVMDYVNNRTILVTGGGGSIGSELCRQLAQHNPKKLIILDIYENNAYEIQQELLSKYPQLDLVTLIASVRNTERLNYIFDTYRPDIVYHAAAHKHVPLMESSPTEAIKNNVFGTLKTVKAADKFGVKKFVLISSDKAVNPTNIMGASKRICEMIIQAYDNMSKTEFVAVRFGNVLGSNGSVIPLFKKQIASGGPVKITHPDIIRYFMTIPEAVSLVLQAGAYAKGGEIFILDMGEPVKILDLAVNLIKLSGYTPHEDIKIEFIGLRPGEKLYEELLMADENKKPTKNNLIFIANPIEFNENIFFKKLYRLNEAALNEEQDIRDIVKEIVDTYVEPETDLKKSENKKNYLKNIESKLEHKAIKKTEEAVPVIS